ncbi:hypothetical protein PV326_012274 [Microctonus aethiopoides]|nr:hypothetical protein PV326_012274 [Microctonus aethiopoides]
MFQNTHKSIGSNDTSNSGSTAAAPAAAVTSMNDENSSEHHETNHENGHGSVHNSEGDASLSTTEEQSNDNGITGNGNISSSKKGLNLKMSAKELRAKLAARKKYDPKKESIGFKDKFDIVQKL